MERKPENQIPKLPPYKYGSKLTRYALIADFGEPNDVNNIKKREKMEYLFQTLGYEIKFWNCNSKRVSKEGFLKYLDGIACDLSPDSEVFAMVIFCPTQDGQLRIPGSISEPRCDMEEIYMKFNGKNCKALIGKPKIFIFNTYPYVGIKDPKLSSGGPMPLIPKENKCNLTIPLEADLLVIWSFEGYVGPSEPSPASIPSNSPKVSFLDVLDEVLREDFVKEGDHKNILELIVSVSSKLLEINKNEPLPVTLSTLNSLYYLK